MKLDGWIGFLSRPAQNNTAVPDLQASVAHLVGPGELHVEGEKLVYRTSRLAQLRLDPRQLELLLCFGKVQVSADAIACLTQHQVVVSWLSAQGQHLRGQLLPHQHERALVRIQQYRVLDDDRQRRLLARRIVMEKIESQLAAVQHYRRQGKRRKKDSEERLAGFYSGCEQECLSVEQLRGMEGAASACWFQAYGQLFVKPWSFSGRVKRHSSSSINALLNLGYTLLLNRTVARISAAYLEPALGVLHAYRAGRMSLACDLMEPFRVPTVDRWVLGLCNQGKLTRADFLQSEDSTAATRLTEGAFVEVLANWQDHWFAKRYEELLDRAVQQFSRQLKEYGQSWKGLIASISD